MHSNKISPQTFQLGKYFRAHMPWEIFIVYSCSCFNIAIFYRFFLYVGTIYLLFFSLSHLVNHMKNLDLRLRFFFVYILVQFPPFIKKNYSDKINESALNLSMIQFDSKQCVPLNLHSHVDETIGHFHQIRTFTLFE